MSTAPEGDIGRRSTRPVVIWVVALLGGATLFAALFPLATLINSYGVRHGAVLYQAHCASCHGTERAGQPNWQAGGNRTDWPAPPLSEAGHAWMHNDAELFTYVKFSAAGSPMPAFGKTLTDNQIWQILAYTKSHWPEGVRAFQHRGDPYAALPADLPADWLYPPSCEPGAAPGGGVF